MTDTRIVDEQRPVLIGDARPAEPTASSDRAKIVGFAMMALGMFIALLDIQIVASSLKQIGGALSASTEETAWVQTSYLVAEIVVIPLSGFLCRLLSTHWLFAISAAGFTIASVLCGSAWSIDSMIAFRALQGLMGGSMIPTVFAASFALFSGRERATATAAMGIIATLAPTIGATLGGWITENWSWPLLFYVNIVPGFAIAAVVLLTVRYDKPHPHLVWEADIIGIVLMAASLACLELVLEEGPRHDWLGDETLFRASWVSALTGVAFIIRSLVIKAPVVDLRAFRDRNFSYGCAASFVLGLGMFSAIYVVPYYLAEVRSFSSLDIGLAISTTGIFQMLSIPIGAAAARRIDLRLLIAFGYALFALSMWMMTSITDDWGWRELFLPQALRGFSIVFCILPANVMALGALPIEALQLASGLYNLMRNLGGAIGIALAGTLLHDRTRLHAERLIETASRRGSALAARHELAAAATRLVGDARRADILSLKVLYRAFERQALVSSVADICLLIALCFVAIAVLAPMARWCSFDSVGEREAH